MFFILTFSRLFLDYLLVENMPISIVNRERTTPEVVSWKSDQLKFGQISKFDLLEFSELEKLNKIEKMS